MASSSSSVPLFFHFFFFFFFAVFNFSDANANGKCWNPPLDPIPVYPIDANLLNFALNLEYLECELFFHGAFGKGLDSFAPALAKGGPPPIGGMKANLDPLVHQIIEMFAYEEVGHIRTIQETIRGIPRPLIDISKHTFAILMDEAFGYHLSPPFDPYANSVNFMLACYVVPYMGLVAYVGASVNTLGYLARRKVGGLLGIEGGQDAVIRTWLYERGEQIVSPYNYTIIDFTSKISILRNKLAGCGIRDEGILVPKWLGAQGKISTNILAGNKDSISYMRTPKEVLAVVYSTGDARKPGGFYPIGANGTIAREFLNNNLT